MSEQSSEQRHRDDIVSQNRTEYVTAGLDNAQCHECGSERITETKAQGKAKPVPSEKRARCNECGHADHPFAFQQIYRLEQMPDAMRQKIDEARDLVESRIVDDHASAHGISSRREP